MRTAIFGNRSPSVRDSSGPGTGPGPGSGWRRWPPWERPIFRRSGRKVCAGKGSAGASSSGLVSGRPWSGCLPSWRRLSGDGLPGSDTGRNLRRPFFGRDSDSGCDYDFDYDSCFGSVRRLDLMIGRRSRLIGIDPWGIEVFGMPLLEEGIRLGWVTELIPPPDSTELAGSRRASRAASVSKVQSNDRIPLKWRLLILCRKMQRTPGPARPDSPGRPSRVQAPGRSNEGAVFGGMMAGLAGSMSFSTR